MSYKAIPVSGKDEFEVWVRARKKFPYMEVAMLISEGHEVFVPELNKKTASYARGKLSKLLGVEVLCFPATFKGEDGYIFKVSTSRELLGEHGGEDKKGDRKA